MNVLEIFKLRPVKAFNSKTAVPRNAVDATLLFGLELETEGINTDPTELYVSGMGGTEDNSLRQTPTGRAWEYITQPASYSVMMDILDRFFAKAKFNEKNYSERCSVHVHVNVQDCTVPQLKAICFLYQVFERVLYNFAGADRDKNIFCVPWNQTIITHGILDTLTPESLIGVKRWMKYTGLNLIPISTQGTIEFRHLPGTADTARISTWLQLIASVVSYGKNTDVEALEKEIVALNTNSQYKKFFYQVFKDYAFALEERNLDQLLELGVMDMKYAIMSSSKKNLAAKKAAVQAEVPAFLRNWEEDQERIRQEPPPQPEELPRGFIFNDPDQAARVAAEAAGLANELQVRRGVNVDIEARPAGAPVGEQRWFGDPWPPVARQVDPRIRPAQPVRPGTRNPIPGRRP